jgi:hypothetical protein
MSVARVVSGALFCALAALSGCGERSGDPVVRLASDGEETAASAGPPGAAGAPAPPEGAGGSDDGFAEQGPTGICGPCRSSDQCGDANDVCIRHDDQRFCGRDCDEQHGCPDSYACVQLQNSQLWQCVPQNGCPSEPTSLPSLSDVRQYVLSRINAERAARSEDPLQASDCLDALAQDSALAFASTDEPLGKYVRECDPVWPNCACGWSAEAEITVARYALDWTTAVERAGAVSRAGQNDRFTQAFLENDFKDVGIGFWLSGDEAWIALSFR